MVDPWTILGVTKIIVSGLSGDWFGVARGMFLLDVPGTGWLDIAETAVQVWDFDGAPIGPATISGSSYIPLARIRLANEDFVRSRMSSLSFLEISKPTFPRFERLEPTRITFPQMRPLNVD